jgi:hypothetical protein
MSTSEQEVFIISSYTEEILKRRANSDYRIHFINYLLFENKVREDIAKANQAYALRETLPGDMFSYTLVPEDDMKITVARNISDIAKMKANKQLQNLKQVWLFCLESDKESASSNITIYSNPDSKDINEYFKEDSTMLAMALALEYADENGKTQTVNWHIISPGDMLRMNEYIEYLKKRESDTLSDMFFIDFHKTDEKEIAAKK